MSEAKQRPSHRLYVQHDADNRESKDRTEVGAIWPHKSGGGFGITIKRGISLSSLNGTRIVAFPLQDEDGDAASRGRGANRD